MLNWLSLSAGILAGLFALGIFLLGRRAKKQSLADKLKIEMLENNYQALLEMYEKKAVLVHDTKNHMRAIAKMLMDGREEGALAYITQITGEMQQDSGAFYTNHRMLDSILNMKYQEAAQHGIRMQCRYDDMREMSLTLVEICALFTNLLDNAIEANLNCPAAAERKIEMICRKHGNMLIVTIVNPIGDIPRRKEPEGDVLAGNTSAEEDSGEGQYPGNHFTENALMEKASRKPVTERRAAFRTTKKDKDMHGFGMVSIRKVLDSHGGYMKTDIQNHQFRIVVYLTAFKSG
ncbi:MAG: GHKL domain-containing protein [Lachnospiraceae bacterium]|jgi:sensor histidine kinase YesM|nr:GHKL domain-containing protein [Lachnospiraceae bacterium]